jgi:hypothetical protein
MKNLKDIIIERLIISKNKEVPKNLDFTFENFYDKLFNFGMLNFGEFAKEYHYGRPIKVLANKKWVPKELYAGKYSDQTTDAVVCVLENINNQKDTRIQYARDLTELVYLLGEYIAKDMIDYIA